MTTITVQDKYITALSALGDLRAAIDQALQRYTIEQIVDKIAQLRRLDRKFQAKYGLDYPAFAEQITEDTAFVQEIEATINPLWEADLAEWEFCVRGAEDWTRRLQTLLLT